MLWAQRLRPWVPGAGPTCTWQRSHLVWSDGSQPVAAGDGWMDGQTGLVSSGRSQCVCHSERWQSSCVFGKGNSCLGGRNQRLPRPHPSPVALRRRQGLQGSAWAWEWTRGPGQKQVGGAGSRSVSAGRLRPRPAASAGGCCSTFLCSASGPGALPCPQTLGTVTTRPAECGEVTLPDFWDWSPQASAPGVRGQVPGYGRARVCGLPPSRPAAQRGCLQPLAPASGFLLGSSAPTHVSSC